MNLNHIFILLISLFLIISCRNEPNQNSKLYDEMHRLANKQEKLELKNLELEVEIKKRKAIEEEYLRETQKDKELIEARIRKDETMKYQELKRIQKEKATKSEKIIRKEERIKIAKQIKLKKEHEKRVEIEKTKKHQLKVNKVLQGLEIRIQSAIQCSANENKKSVITSVQLTKTNILLDRIEFEGNYEGKNFIPYSGLLRGTIGLNTNKFTDLQFKIKFKRWTNLSNRCLN